MKDPTTVLVTGATGFLGSNVLDALAKRRDVRVIAACRSPGRLPPSFTGERRVGDLMDPGYRRDVVEGIDVLCHAGTWGAFWGHARQERERFYEPTLDLLEQSIAADVGRFVLASTVAIGTPRRDDAPHDDFEATRYTGFWPHVDRLIDLDRWMQRNADRGTTMINMRLGHFVGRGNALGMVPAIAPRLRTRMVPWLARGRGRLALVADTDLGEAFACAAVAEGLEPYESFNICGNEFPTSREVFDLIADHTGLPRPWFSVPFGAGYAFGWLMESLYPVLSGKAPFLTRSLVHVAESWVAPSDYARAKMGYAPQRDWRDAVRESLDELSAKAYPWPRLNQATT